MTLRELILCASPLPTGNTVRVHMQAMTCDFIGGSVTVNGEFIDLVEDKSVVIAEEFISLSDEDSDIIDIEESSLNTDEGELIDVIC